MKTDQTWNPVVGCSKVSPGCAHCYAETMAARLKAMALADIEAGRDPGRKRYYIDAIDDKGRWSGKLIPVPEALGDPLSWKKPRQVFVNSMSDLFHESVPFAFIDQVFAVMAYCTDHTFQVLTKRGKRMEAYFKDRSLGDVYTNILQLESDEAAWSKSPHDRLRSLLKLTDSWELKDGYRNPLAPPKEWPLPNVWLGVSVERQNETSRIHHLLKSPATVRFLSCEPVLDKIDLTAIDVPESLQAKPNGGFRFDAIKNNDDRYWNAENHIDWVIVGGESGPGARACRPEWIRSIVRQCQDASVPIFVKQLGGNVVTRNDMVEDQFNSQENGWPDPHVEHHIHGFQENYQGADCRIRLRDKKGGDMSEWPEDLRVREFPAMETA